MTDQALSTQISDTGASGRDIVGSLQRGLAVLEILATNPTGLTLTETAEKAGLTRAGARRFLLTLVASGYATQDGRRFRLSPRLLSLARTSLGGASLWTYAEPFMREVSEKLGESCSAAVLDGENVLYVARIAGQRIVSVALHVGTRLPAYCTAMGRVLLSDMPEEELNAFFRRASIHANTPKTITDPRHLSEKVTETRRQGYAIVDEELELGLRSIAVPIRDRTGRIAAAINVSTQSARFTSDDMREIILPHLQSAAERIEDFFAVQ